MLLCCHLGYRQVALSTGCTSAKRSGRRPPRSRPSVIRFWTHCLGIAATERGVFKAWLILRTDNRFSDKKVCNVLQYLVIIAFPKRNSLQGQLPPLASTPWPFPPTRKFYEYCHFSVSNWCWRELLAPKHLTHPGRVFSLSGSLESLEDGQILFAFPQCSGFFKLASLELPYNFHLTSLEPPGKWLYWEDFLSKTPLPPSPKRDQLNSME